jgi:site-specific DNA-methyltransferase (adenine-specific)
MDIFPEYRNSSAAIYVGDCADILRDCPLRFPLIVADPPYNIGHGYVGFEDKQSDAEFAHWLYLRLSCAIDLLAKNGSLWVLLPPKWTQLVVHPLVQSKKLVVHQQIIWSYRFGQHMDAKFIPSHAIWSWIVRAGEKPTFNPDAVLVESDRRSKYGDKRIADAPRAGMRVPLTVWDEFPRVQGNNAERRDKHPNQLPEAMLARIIGACSNPGDLVLDPFLGSGTTCVVAQAMGRPSVGIEISKESAASAWERINEIGAIRPVARNRLGVPL